MTKVGWSGWLRHRDSPPKAKPRARRSARPSVWPLRCSAMARPTGRTPSAQGRRTPRPPGRSWRKRRRTSSRPRGPPSGAVASRDSSRRLKTQPMPGRTCRRGKRTRRPTRTGRSRHLKKSLPHRTAVLRIAALGRLQDRGPPVRHGRARSREPVAAADAHHGCPERSHRNDDDDRQGQRAARRAGKRARGVARVDRAVGGVRADPPPRWVQHLPPRRVPGRDRVRRGRGPVGGRAGSWRSRTTRWARRRRPC